MNINDPISDMLTRIRNAHMRNKESCSSPSSQLRSHILDVLRDEGYIRGYTKTDFKNGKVELTIELKYHEGKPVIQEIKRVSRPGRRVYSSVKSMPVIHNGLGISILSTPKGVMSDNQARELNVGGEVLCCVF
ncbi:MAG: 30S ribosomal protein S8 [Parvibaculales bacterium]